MKNNHKNVPRTTQQDEKTCIAKAIQHPRRIHAWLSLTVPQIPPRAHLRNQSPPPHLSNPTAQYNRYAIAQVYSFQPNTPPLLLQWGLDSWPLMNEHRRSRRSFEIEAWWKKCFKTPLPNKVENKHHNTWSPHDTCHKAVDTKSA